MRDKRKLFAWYGTIFLSGLMLTACGGRSDTYGSEYAAVNDGGYASSAMEEEAYYDEAEEKSTISTSEADIVKSTMMVAKDASLSVDVGNLEEFATSLTGKVEEFGGYFESSSIDNYSSDYQTDRYANFTIRVPAKNLDPFLNYMDGNTSVTSKSVNAEDVSLEYVDTEAKIKSLEKERDNLNRLLDKTDSVSEILEIESKLSEVMYELDSYKSRKRVLKGRVDYSTVNISAHEERNVEHPVRMAFEINFKERAIEGIETAMETFVTLIVAIPTIIIVTAFVLLFLWVIRKVWGKLFKREKKGAGKKYRYMRFPVEIVEDEDVATKGAGVAPEAEDAAATVVAPDETPVVEAAADETPEVENDEKEAHPLGK